VDTAPFYGFGQAERCVGDALRDVPRDEWVLSTKVGRLLRPHGNLAAQNRMPFDAVFDYSYDAIMRSFEDSLQRLGLGRIDILYAHDIGAMQHGREGHPTIMRTLRGGGYRALEELRRCGVVRAIGIGVNEPGTPSFSPGATRSSSRDRSMICCRSAFLRGYRSLLAVR